jgi:tetratricopeptide (TPR) repeat protein
MAKAVRYHKQGGPEVLQLDEVQVGDPGQGQVRIRHTAIGVNFVDIYFRKGVYKPPGGFPLINGQEGAGVVTAVGEGVDSVQAGDHVFGSSMTGAFSEQVVVPAHALRKVPNAVALEAAAAFWVAHATAYHALRSIAEVRPGERVVVLGAAGGVGLAAVELAVAIEPTHAEAQTNLGVVLFQLGQPEPGLQHLSEAVRLDPGSGQAQGNLGSALFVQGSFQQAIDHLERATKLKPDDANTWAALAQSYAQLKRSTEAFAAAHRALELARSQGKATLAREIESWTAGEGNSPAGAVPNSSLPPAPATP